MSANLSEFFSAVDAIQAEAPTYRSGGKAEDGTCDCIGLIIGALSRCGTKWPGIHGSNWAARNAMAWLLPVASAEDLAVGEIVYKARQPGDTAYSLPSRYDQDPDRRDYYHVGVVRSISPLRIIHCTSPGGVVTDTRLGKWCYGGWLQLISHEEGDEEPVSESKTAVVVADSGSTVNLRATPGGDLVERIPVGAVVSVSAQQDGWVRVSHEGKSGWMKAEFLRVGSADGLSDSGESVQITLPRSLAGQLRDALDSVLGRG